MLPLRENSRSAGFDPHHELSLTCTSSDPLVLAPLDDNRRAASMGPSARRLALLLLDTDLECPLH